MSFTVGSAKTASVPLIAACELAPWNELELPAATVAFFAWAYNQPTDFDLFVEAQKEFIDDLYDGKLLTDYSQQSKDDIDLVKRPSWAELAAEEIKSRQEEEEAEKIQEMHRKNLHGEEAVSYTHLTLPTKA